MSLRSIDPQTKSGAQIRAMFDDIAPRYDLLNRLLSAGQDRRWRRVAVQETLAGHTAADRLDVLDVCAGTGDLACEFGEHPAVDSVTGLDFVGSMIQQARAKGPEGHCWLVGDAMRLPFPDGRFDVVSVAFGLRNLTDPAAGIREMARMLRPRGRLAILEFFLPARGLRSGLFRWYFNNVLPRIGRLVSGSQQYDAYQYLPDSVEAFATPSEVEQWMLAAGLARVRRRPLTLGTVGLLVAEKAIAATGDRDLESRSTSHPTMETAGLVRIA